MIPARATVLPHATDGVQPRLVAVIPAFNEASTIRGIASETLRHVAAVVVVDDGSTDGTAAALAGLPVTVLRHEVNRGKAASLRLGFAEALRHGACAAITLDGDGQHDPRDIPRLVAAYVQNPGSIVIGTRLHDRERIPLARYLANQSANYGVKRATGFAYPDSQSGFRIYPSTLLRSRIVSENDSMRFVFETEILIDSARSGISSVAVPIAATYPTGARASHFRPVCDVLLIALMLTSKILRRAWRVSAGRLLPRSAASSGVN